MLRIIVDFGVLQFGGLSIPLRIYGYGLMLVLGYVTSLLLAQWRARRCGESPEIITTCGILALVGGIVGARVAYVIENWSEFAGRPGGFASVASISSGGLIYYGGLALASVVVLVYFSYKKLPFRRYLDILAPSLMIGLAFGRAGCLLNGCCYGGPADENWLMATHVSMYSKPLVALNNKTDGFSTGQEGPSPVYADQLNHGRIMPDRRLLSRRGLLRPEDMHSKLDRDQLVVVFAGQDGQADFAKKYDRLAGADRVISEAEWRHSLEPDGLLAGSEQWDDAIAFDRNFDGYLSLAEVNAFFADRREWVTRYFGDDRALANAYLQADLFDLAAQSKSLAVKPAQAIGLVNALLLALLLSGFYRLRWREGQVFVLLMIIYPATRFVLEGIRSDERAGWFFTHNQYTSMGMIIAGIILWVWLQRLPASAGPNWRQRHEALQAARAQTGPSVNRNKTKRTKMERMRR